MSVHDRPHMVYEGSRPRRLATPATVAQNAGPRSGPASADREQMRADAKLAVALSIVGALGLGMGLGVWMTPMLGDNNPFLAPRAETAPLAMSLTVPSTTAPAALDVAPPAAEVLPADPKPRAKAADPPRKLKVATAQAKVLAPARTAGGCSLDGSRSKVTLCADPTIAAADQDMESAFQRALHSGAAVKALRVDQQAWLVLRDEAARRSPADLAEAYDRRVSQLNALADDPPR